MATEAKILRGPSSGVKSQPESSLIDRQTQEHHSLRVLESNPAKHSPSDFVLIYNRADRLWTSELAQRLQGEDFGNPNLRLSPVNWGSVGELGTLDQMRNNLPVSGYLGIVVSKPMLQEDWPAVQRTIESWREQVPVNARIVAILKENVSLPPLLRLGEWFDFRTEKYFEESLSDLSIFLGDSLAPVEKIAPQDPGLQPYSAKRDEPVGGLYAFGVCAAKERVLSNLFPVVELPKLVFSAETRFRTESEVTEACAGAGPLTFLLKGSRLYTVEPLSENSVFAPAVMSGDRPQQENFAQWFSRSDPAGWGIELLNGLFRHHAWKRGLRWEKRTEQYYFPRTKPKSVWWEIGGQTISREVTAPNMGWIELDNQARAEVQYGWMHQSIRAGFIQVLGNLCLRLEPGWLLTELDGKTPATEQPVMPVFSGTPQQERNGQVLRSLRFWSAVLAKGHHEIRMNTGQAPVRTRLTPLSGFTPFGIPSDKMDYDQLMLEEMEDDLLMPALGPLEQ